MCGMQPIDPADKRQPNAQIAASIRAAILTGELEPGSQLPPGHELAKFFGVSRMTVQTAIRTLRDEGFVRSRTGSGVYVRDQASLPVPGETDHPLAGAATFLFEMGHLKHLSRAGWLLLGIGQPDAVAKVVQDLAAEYEAAETRESRLAHDADKIETLLQAIEYEAQGHDAAAWRETSLAALRTDSGRQLAQAIGSADPHGWWSAFAASYAELRASSRGRGRTQPGRTTE